MRKPRIVVMGSFVADLAGRGPRIPAVGETVKGNHFRIGRAAKVPTRLRPPAGLAGAWP